MAGFVQVLLRWSTRMRRQSPADVVLSCSKVLGSWMTSPKYLGECQRAWLTWARVPLTNAKMNSHCELLDDHPKVVVLLNVRQLARVEMNRDGARLPRRTRARLDAERHRKGPRAAIVDWRVAGWWCPRVTLRGERAFRRRAGRCRRQNRAAGRRRPR
jgi:hypothetical protein